MIPVERYTSQDAFDRENRDFWPRQWVCVGTTHQLGRHNDFLTVTVGGRGVVIQNFDGSIRAFTNVCSHRFNRLQTERCGSRSLVCRYHGWGYDCDGVPDRIPSRPRFDGIVPAEHALERWSVQIVGTLVFVSLAPDGGIDVPEAAAMSAAFGDLLDVNVMNVKCNWKLFVENTLEGYHVPWVHPKSIMRIMGSESRFSFSGWHSSVTTTIDSPKFAAFEHFFAARPYKIDEYRHLLIWPSATLATTKGMSFALQLFEPVSPSETRFTSMTFAASVSLPAGIAEAFHRSVVDINRTIFDEDRVVCEQLQRGVADARTPGILSDEEERVARFHQAYMESCP